MCPSALQEPSLVPLKLVYEHNQAMLRIVPEIPFPSLRFIKEFFRRNVNSHLTTPGNPQTICMHARPLPPTGQMTQDNVKLQLVWAGRSVLALATFLFLSFPHQKQTSGECEKAEDCS